jgi:glycyl-tRNA synthetase beta chain
MTSFLLEILSEEIPASMQKDAALNFAKITAEIFAKNNVEFDPGKIKSLVTPRRLALHVEDLKDLQQLPSVTKIGPKTDANPKAIEGFLRSAKLDKKEDLEIIEHNGASCYCFISKAQEIATKDLITNSIPSILTKMITIWPKLMRWDVADQNGSLKQPRWIRPIRNILCLFGSEVVEFEFAAQKSNNLSYGNFLYNLSPIKINNADDYQEILRKNFVVIDQEERKNSIIKQIEEITKSLHLETIDNLDFGLIDEVCGLCENPTAIIGDIDKKFLELPPEILILTMKLNQKYFCLKSLESGQLAPKFIFISNAIINQNNATKIAVDNQKVVSARLSDAKFFIDEDLKIPLISRLDELKNIIFHKSLGSVFDKIKRLEDIAKLTALWVPHADLSLVVRAANLAKNDLTTKAVAEFPELQGKIGSYYAVKQVENRQVAIAISEHYLPTGPNSDLPITPLGIVLSLSDKIDNIAGMFLIGQKPTSSKDPYALRRSALGIIRIMLDDNIAIAVKLVIEKSLSLYDPKLIKEHLGLKDLRQQKNLLTIEIVKFILERLRIYLKETENLRPDIINAVIDDYLLTAIDKDKYCDLLKIAIKVRFLDGFVKNKDNQKIIELYKRSANIVAIAERQDNKIYSGKKILLQPRNIHEKNLFLAIKKIKSDYKKLVKKSEFDKAFDLLAILQEPIANFFEHLQINDPNREVRKHRLILLAKVRDLFGKVADFSKIETGEL